MLNISKTYIELLLCLIDLLLRCVNLSAAPSVWGINELSPIDLVLVDENLRQRDLMVLVNIKLSVRIEV